MFQIPVGSGYAELFPIYREPDQTNCELCLDSIEPDLLVEWKEGSDSIADFTNAYGRIVIKESVANELMLEFNGGKKTSLQFSQHPNLFKPKVLKKRSPKTIWLPYSGPPICELRASVVIPFHPKSTIKIEEQCEMCGSIVYEEFEGIEVKDSHKHVPRIEGKGLFFDQNDLEGIDIFRPRDTGMLLCSEKVKDYIEDKQFSNVEFLEVGETV